MEGSLGHHEWHKIPPPIIERISKAALRLGNKIYEGNSHFDALTKMNLENPGWRDSGLGTPEDGFMTNTKRFVDRDEADIIALKAEQIDSSVGSLHSEDIDELRDGTHY
jgi:hypothetical protein